MDAATMMYALQADLAMQAAGRSRKLDSFARSIRHLRYAGSSFHTGEDFCLDAWELEPSAESD